MEHRWILLNAKHLDELGSFDFDCIVKSLVGNECTTVQNSEYVLGDLIGFCYSTKQFLLDINRGATGVVNTVREIIIPLSTAKIDIRCLINSDVVLQWKREHICSGKLFNVKNYKGFVCKDGDRCGFEANLHEFEFSEIWLDDNYMLYESE